MLQPKSENKHVYWLLFTLITMHDSTTIDEFTKGLSSLSAFLLKFSSENYEKLHAQTVARSIPTAVGASTLNSMLTLASKHQKMLVSNINVILYEFIVFFNEFFLSSCKIKTKINITPIAKLIKELMANNLKNVDKHNLNYEFPEEDILVLEIILEKIENYNPSIDVATLSEISDLKRKVAEFEKLQTQSNNDPNLNTREYRLNNLSEDFEKSKTLLLSEIENKLISLNHVDNFNVHLTNRTVPSSLFYNRFPYPMFDRDPEFVRQFNEIIHDSQVKFIKLCSSFCVDKAGKHLENIEKIIDKYKNNYDMAIIYKDLEQKVTDNLKDKFTKSATKVSSYVPRGYIHKTNVSTPNSSPPRKRLNFVNSNGSNSSNFSRDNRFQFNNTPRMNNNNKNYENASIDNNISRSYRGNAAPSFNSNNNNDNYGNYQNNRNSKRQRSRSFHNKNSSNYFRKRSNNNNNDNQDRNFSNSNNNDQVFDQRNYPNQYV